MDGDAELVARVRRGDRDSFDDLYDRYADDVFSLCLVILGDPAVAKAAAGTAFALVARTRLDLLSDPDRLRPWLLELARGSALAWSSSPRARSAPIPHGVSAETLIDGGVVPAPASLRIGLTRTFDRATVAAAEERAAQRSRSWDAASSTATPSAPPTAPVPTTTPLLPTTAPITAPISATAPVPVPPAASGVEDADDVPPGDEPTVILPTSRPAAFGNTRPLATGGDRTRPPGVVPLPRHGAGLDATTRGQRTKPALAVAAAILVATAVGVALAVNGPSGGSSVDAEHLPDAAVIAPSGTDTAPSPRTVMIAPTPPGAVAVAPSPPAAGAEPTSATMTPTVAGAFTSIPAENDDEPAGGLPAGSRPRVATVGVAPAPAPAPPPATEEQTSPSGPAPDTNPPPSTNQSAPNPPSTSPADPGPPESSAAPPPAQAPSDTPPAAEPPAEAPPAEEPPAETPAESPPAAEVPAETSAGTSSAAEPTTSESVFGA